MRNTQDLKEFILKWRGLSKPSKELLYGYRQFCRGLMYEDEETVRDVTSILRKNIELWASKNSPVYSRFEGVISRQELMDKSRWYVKSMSHESQPMATSGSTTGTPFSYLRWEPFLYFIEATNHYDLIMDEFSIKNKPEVMYFFNTNRYEKSKAVTVSDESDNFMEHHGTKRRANVHYVNFSMFQENKDIFFNELFDHFIKNKLDVIFAPGPSINSMCYHMKKYGFDSNACRLLSNSNERLLREDASFLLDGRAEHICDHMRSWDGGATFFTCSHMNYHLLDNLAWCEDVDGKLVCTDYFSLPSPFVRYWNGDFCQISDRYERCKCGRLYRDFEFLENRPFSLKGRSILDIKETLDSMDIRCIKQVRCSAEYVEVVSYLPIREEHKKALMDKYRFKFRFTMENETRPT